MANEAAGPSSDKKADDIAYECSKHNIKLIRCPVRHMGTEYSYDVLKAMYDHLATMPGFTFLSETHADPVISGSKVTGAELTAKDGTKTQVSSDYVVADPG